MALSLASARAAKLAAAKKRMKKIRNLQAIVEAAEEGMRPAKAAKLRKLKDLRKESKHAKRDEALAAAKKRFENQPKSKAGWISGIDMISVASSNLASVGYSVEYERLEVHFHHGKWDYQHIGVPQTVFDRLISASSKGKYYYWAIAYNWRAGSPAYPYIKR